MNEIRLGRMLLAGLAMFVVWIALEILVEQVVSRILFAQTSQEMWLGTIDLSDWSALNFVVNIAIGLLNCIVLIWLYASLRPMYGVGTRTALITSAFGVIWGLSLFVNIINLGLIPARIGLIEAVFVTIELPIAMIAGATVYEGNEKGVREAA